MRDGYSEVKDFYQIDGNILKSAENELIWLKRSFDEAVTDTKVKLY